MIPEIDFQEGYESREDGVEAPARRVHREGVKLNRTSNVVVFLKTGVEDFAAEEDDISVFDAIIERAYSLKSEKEAWEFIESAVLRMVMVLKMPRTKTSEMFCKAWLVDTLDIRVDMKRPDPGDRRANHIRYPRLSHLAQRNPETFHKFQRAMNLFVGLPDLASTNPDKPKPEGYRSHCIAKCCAVCYAA